MSISIGALAASGSIALIASYAIYRYLLKTQDGYGGEGDATKKADADEKFDADEVKARRYKAFGRDITGIIRAAEDSPMNDEILRVFREHMGKYKRTFDDGKISIPFECLIPMTHSLQPIVNEKGEVLVRCFRDNRLKTAPIIDEKTPEKTEEENFILAERKREHLEEKPQTDFVQSVLGKREDKENKGQREASIKEKPSNSVSVEVSASNSQKKVAGAVDLLAFIDESADGDIFSALEEGAITIGDDESVKRDSPEGAEGNKSTNKENSSSTDNTKEDEVPIPNTTPSPAAPQGAGDFALPVRISFSECPKNSDLFKSVEKRIAEEDEVKRAVVHNLAYHRHIILYNAAYFLIEQQFLADAVVETFKECFTKAPGLIKSFHKEYKLLSGIAESLASDPEIGDAGWDRMRSACIEVDGTPYRGWFIRTGPGLVEKYLGVDMLARMYEAPHIRADYIDPSGCNKAKSIHKVF